MSIGISCDLIDDKSCGSISTSFSCTIIDNSSCNESLITENDLLKKEITCLTNNLRKCYDSRAKFNHCWASQKFTQSSLGWLWHRRLDHVGMKQLNRLLKHDLVVGLKNVKFEKDKLCSACQA